MDGPLYLSNMRAKVASWGDENLDGNGRYIGKDLRKYGFPFAPGEWVPVDARYSAMCEHGWASTAAGIALHQALSRAKASLARPFPKA